MDQASKSLEQFPSNEGTPNAFIGNPDFFFESPDAKCPCPETGFSFKRKLQHALDSLDGTKMAMPINKALSGFKRETR